MGHFKVAVDHKEEEMFFGIEKDGELLKKYAKAVIAINTVEYLLYEMIYARDVEKAEPKATLGRLIGETREMIDFSGNLDELNEMRKKLIHVVSAEGVSIDSVTKLPKSNGCYYSIKRDGTKVAIDDFFLDECIKKATRCVKKIYDYIVRRFEHGGGTKA
ncbi:MAG: hypothetical protein U9Q03_04405 [Patescibacteria group bacterium]|nr:hypothetical protein [Patescibacteria group bacterium]